MTLNRNETTLRGTISLGVAAALLLATSLPADADGDRRFKTRESTRTSIYSGAKGGSYGGGGRPQTNNIQVNVNQSNYGNQNNYGHQNNYGGQNNYGSRPSGFYGGSSYHPPSSGNHYGSHYGGGYGSYYGPSYDHHHDGYYGYRNDDDDDHDNGKALGIIAAALIGAIVIGAVVSSLPKTGCEPFEFDGITYQHCGNTFYKPEYSHGDVRYRVVKQPE